MLSASPPPSILKKETIMSELFVQQVIDSTETNVDKIALNIGAAEGRYIDPLLVKYREVYAIEADIFSPGKVPAVKSAYDAARNFNISPSTLRTIYETAVISSGNASTLKNALEKVLTSLEKGQVVPLFDFERVTVFDKAIGPKHGTVKLYMSSLNVGRHTINEDHWKHHGQSWGYSDKFEEVESLTIDEISANKSIGSIVCDIEGGEALIFSGGRRTLRDNDIDAIIELHHDINFWPMINIFKDFGYNIYSEKNQSNDGMIHALFSNRDQWKNNLPSFMTPIEL
jgi:FkbM family methyltransferase